MTDKPPPQAAVTEDMASDESASRPIQKPVKVESSGATQLANGVPESHFQPTVAVALQDQLRQLPPEIAQISEGYHPLSLLFERTAQETFSQLTDLIARLDASGGSGKINGIIAHDGQQSPEGVDRRRQWLEFAQRNREKFLKLLVLLQWGQSTREPIGRLVNVMTWMRERQMADEAALERLGWLKKELFDLRMPNPDIDRALEILASSQSVRIPDFGYLAQTPLSAQKILRQFANVNILLHVRLNVHETLPKVLQNFTIASGRVTFTIPKEFAMDLSILDEDSTARFFLIDFRFLFSPCTEIPTGQLRTELEMRAASVLASEGLTGCYEFLHDFVLTYKLSILRRQALELARDSWQGNLRVERVHRSLILQYWISRPGKKSWIEIGIRSGKDFDEATQEEDQQPQLFVKWVRHGKTVPPSEAIELDEATLDVEGLLEQVTGRHLRQIFESAIKSLTSLIPSRAASTIRLRTSTRDASGCSLVLPLLSGYNATVRIEPTTGSFAISPASDIATRGEQVLNTLKDPIEELALRINRWRADYALTKIKAAAPLSGWELDSSRLSLDSSTRIRHFEDSQATPILIRHWPQSRHVVAACYDGCSAFNVWLLDVKPPAQKLYEGEGLQILSSRRLRIEGAQLSPQFFNNLEVTATGIIQSVTLYSRLDQLQLPFSVTGWKSPTSLRKIGVDVRKLSLHPSISKTIALTFRPIQVSRASNHQTNWMVVHTMRTMVAQSPLMSALMFAFRSDDTTLNSGGALAVADWSPLGTHDAIDNLIRKLRRISEILTCLEALHDLKLKLNVVSFESISFSYAGTPQELSASISRENSSSKPRLAFAPPSNPHHRLLSILQAAISDRNKVFGKFLAILPSMLLFTLPLLRGFDNIEENREHRPRVYVIDMENYSIVYTKPRCNISIRYQNRDETGWWYVSHDRLPTKTPSQPQGQHPINEKLHKSLAEFCLPSRQGDARGLRNGVAARADCIQEVICSLDKLIRSCADTEPAEPERPKPAGKPDQMQQLSNGHPTPRSNPENSQGSSTTAQPMNRNPSSQSQHSSAAQPMSRNSSGQPSTASEPTKPLAKTSNPSENVAQGKPTTNQGQSNGQPTQTAMNAAGRGQPPNAAKSSSQAGQGRGRGQASLQRQQQSQLQQGAGRGQPQLGNGNGKGNAQMQGQNASRMNGNGNGNDNGNGNGKSRPEVIQLD